ncbi:CoA transferase [Vineibacter terrae]|uniref:CoA transferase n=1 Tax=Vineibacter terrae TaxID=2586908 RepID=A0A5C8PQX5_9HYPH|nr:CoA transferase [Vineibacter terrae]TXL77596.1 CoA transferase [Vineibacter terrae]
MTLPLQGIRVVDLSRLLAGPFCTTILADLGADVVKVEALPEGDLYRKSPPFHGGESVSFLAVNRNKRSIGVDFRKPGALDLVRDMAARADVVVENFKPGIMEEMGLSYERLSAANPRLIFASISGFGRTGPYGALPGVDQIAQGMSGFMSITGQAQTGPTRVGVPIGDLVAGMWTAIGVQSALIARQTTGKGQRVDTSLLGGLVGLLSVQGQRQLSLGEVPEVAGNHHPVSSPYGLFHAKDGVFNLSATTPAMWQNLCRHLGMAWLLDDARFATGSARLKNRKELEGLLDERFAQRSRDEWIAELRSLGMPAGPVYDLAQVFADPHIASTGFVETISHPTIGQLAQLASPLKMECFADGSVRRPPPLLGEHTQEILEELALGDRRIAELEEAGVIQARPRAS